MKGDIEKSGVGIGDAATYTLSPGHVEMGNDFSY